MQPDIDDQLDRFHRTGPEFGGWLSNHGPMAVDAMRRLGHHEVVDKWVQSYLGRLEGVPVPRWRIDPSLWREPLGDASRLGDWLVLFENELEHRPWPDVLTIWWPRLLPGAVAAASHPLIRTGHAVRTLGEGITQPRLTELAQAMGYWAARWAPTPTTAPRGQLSLSETFDALPHTQSDGGIRTRLAELGGDDGTWARVTSGLEAVTDPHLVPAALDRLVDAAVTRYASWAPAQPTMLVHMATAPRAANLCLPALPPELWDLTYQHAWATSAAIAAMYRPSTNTRPPTPVHLDDLDEWEAVSRAVDTGDEHAIKFAEVAIESHRRGNPDALNATLLAASLLRPT